MTHARYTVNCSILLTDLPLLERPAAARAAGFDGVEFWWPFPSSTPEPEDIDAFVSAIADAYSPVYNAGLLETLSDALSEVERAEGAVEDAAAALTAAADAARALDADAALGELPRLPRRRPPSSAILPARRTI